MSKATLLETLLPQIIQVKEYGIDRIRAEKEAFWTFRHVYHLAFGIHPQNCSSCPIEAQFEQLMKVSDENTLEKLLNRKFKLQDNAVISMGPDDYTNSNITDEIALTLLKKFPGLHTQFKELPEDWKEQATAFGEKSNEPKMIDHVVTAEDLLNNPDLAEKGIKEGETIQIPEPAQEKEKRIRVLMPDGKNRTRKILAGDLALIGDDAAPDGEHKIKNTTFIVKDGKVSEVKE